MPAESNLYAAVRRYLDQLKADGEPLEYCKTHGSVMQRRGEPDLDVVYHGQAVKIELKAPGGRVTRLQQHRLDQWARAGACVCVARSVSDVVEVLEQARRRSAETVGMEGKAG